MSRRIAHRPRYHYARQFVQPLKQSRQDAFYLHWSYRQRKQPVPEKRSPGYSLALFPFTYRLMGTLIPSRSGY